MRTRDTLVHLAQRACRPMTWLAVVLFTIPFGSLAVWQRMLHQPFWLGDLVSTLTLSMAIGIVSPAPWQWTGDDRLAPPGLQAVLQALLVSLAAITVIFWAYSSLDPHRPGWLLRTNPVRIFLLAPIMAFVGWTIARGERGEIERREIQAQAREAQWAMLTSQLSPHFLFNALSAFAELGRRDWPATERGLLSLAQVYRQLLELSEKAETTLGEERRLVEAYLEVERLRLGDRLTVGWEWDEGLQGQAVPPMLLLPLVENALKHGIAPVSEPCALRISGQRRRGRLLLEVANEGRWDPEAPRARVGVGLRNLSARLHLVFRQDAQLTLGREGAWTHARLDLPAPSSVEVPCP